MQIDTYKTHGEWLWYRSYLKHQPTLHGPCSLVGLLAGPLRPLLPLLLGTRPLLVTSLLQLSLLLNRGHTLHSVTGHLAS